jgi:vacuolar-type H+-ATPase subunit E/Vma4
MTENKKTPNVLVSAIQEQSNQEAQAILQRAKKDAQELLDASREEAERIRSERLADLEGQLNQERQKIISKVHLDIQEMTRKARERFVQDVFCLVKQKLSEERKAKAYSQVLVSLIMEGIPAMDSDEITLVAGDPERKLLSMKCLREIQKKSEMQLKRKIILNLSNKKLNEGGVVLVSEKGRVSFDNRFSARMQRMENELRMRAILEIEKEMNNKLQ